MLHKNRNNIGKNWDIFKPILKKNYNWSSVFTGFTTANSTNLRAKVFRKNSKMFQGHFNLLSADNYLHSIYIVFSSIQSLSCVWLFATPWTAAHQASLSITNSQSLLKLMSIELVMPSNNLILRCPLLLYSASGSFPVSQFFTSGGQSIGVSASASVLPMNIQDWFHLGWPGWISLQSKGLSRVFSNTTVQKH